MTTNITVEKSTGQCYGCGGPIRKATRIVAGIGHLTLCHKCLQWLKGKLMGF